MQPSILQTGAFGRFVTLAQYSGTEDPDIKSGRPVLTAPAMPLEPGEGIEPSTPNLPSLCSATEPSGHVLDAINYIK